MFSKRIMFLAFILLAVGTIISCGQEQEIKSNELEIIEISSEGNETAASGMDHSVNDEDANEKTEELLTPEDDTRETPEKDEFQKRFGESCISEQTFEVELSEYSGAVWFVPFAPSEKNQDFSMQIIQEDEVLAEIHGYVPEKLSGEKFTSLDAVAFYDMNFDDNTDILLIETYGDTSFAAVYYGFGEDEYDYAKYFFVEEELSENISEQIDTLSVSEIRKFLSGGKKNGEFSDYREAYKAVSNLCDLESTGHRKYDLIYFDEDDIPELAAGVNGYYTSLYTYHDGKVYTLMDNWAYGAMGNAGYEYCQGKNNMRNYNADYAGAVLYTTYLAIGEKYSMDVITQIVTYNFDDVDRDGIPDQSELESIGYISISYIDGKEASPEECEAYDVGEYEYIKTIMSLQELQSELDK